MPAKPADLLTLPDGTPAVPAPTPTPPSNVAASFSTKRTAEKGVDIDEVFYPFALPGTLDSDKLQTVIDCGRWIALGAQYVAGGASFVPDGVPQTVAAMDTAIFDAATIVLPGASRPTLHALGRDQAALLVTSFLAYSTGRLSPSQPTGSTGPNRNDRRRSRSSK